MVSIKSIAFGLMFCAGSLAAQIPIANGGTGSATASGARSNLGAAASTDTVPSGAIMFIKTGTCPTGWTQETGFLGLYVLATTAAAGDVGTTGGSTSYTPAGSSAAPTVSSLTAAAQTFTGSSVTSGATSAGTPAGTNTLGGFAEGAISWPANPPTYTGALGTLAAPAHTHTITQSAFTTTKFTTNSSGTAAHTGGGAVTTPSGAASSTTITGAPGGTVAWPVNVPTIASGTFTQPTFTGSLMGTHTHSVTAAGTNGTSAVTGTLNAGAFSGTPATIQPPFVKLIPCSKN